MSLLGNIGKAISDFVPTQVLGKFPHLKAGEVTVISNNDYVHGHTAGEGNTFILTGGNDFQLFRSQDPVLTFITGSANTASYWGAGNQTIYEFGHDNTLRFSEMESAKVDIYGLTSDDKVKVYNTDQTAIQPDGHGGTLVGNLDFHDTSVNPSQVCFLTANENIANTPGLFPL